MKPALRSGAPLTREWTSNPASQNTYDEKAQPQGCAFFVCVWAEVRRRAIDAPSEARDTQRKTVRKKRPAHWQSRYRRNMTLALRANLHTERARGAGAGAGRRRGHGRRRGAQAWARVRACARVRAQAWTRVQARAQACARVRPQAQAWTRAQARVHLTHRAPVLFRPGLTGVVAPGPSGQQSAADP